MSGLDPSMLIGFFCKDEKDWWDFKKRVADVCLPFTFCKKIKIKLNESYLDSFQRRYSVYKGR